MREKAKAELIDVLFSPVDGVIVASLIIIGFFAGSEIVAFATDPTTQISNYWMAFSSFIEKEGLWKSILLPLSVLLGSYGVYLLNTQLPTWGQARRAGINLLSYSLMKRIFLLAALIELPFAYVAISMDLSIWLEIIVLSTLVLSFLLLFLFLALNRDRFRPRKFRIFMAPAVGSAAPFLNLIESAFSLRFLPDFLQNGLETVIRLINPAFA